MTVSSFVRGHIVEFGSDDWRYKDTGITVTQMPERPCPSCGMLAKPGDPDPCLGVLPGVVSACCGHGIHAPFLVMGDKANG